MEELECRIRESKPHIIGINEVLPKKKENKIYKEIFEIEGYDMITHGNVIANEK